MSLRVGRYFQGVSATIGLFNADAVSHGNPFVCTRASGSLSYFLTLTSLSDCDGTPAFLFSHSHPLFQTISYPRMGTYGL